MKLVVVSGLSGSGKSIALHTLEDLGFYCIDNLPLFLLRTLAQGLREQPIPQMAKTAVGIDARNQPERLKEVPRLLEQLQAAQVDTRVLYLEAQPETLIKRFSETRRKHPLTSTHRSLAEAIELERELLEPLRTQAQLRMETTHLNVHQLRDRVREAFAEHRHSQLVVLIETFGFKQGIPQDADFIFDLRCLPNPHWQPDLRPYTGRDPAVARFLESSPAVREMREELFRFFRHWLPRFQADGRSYLTIALGCTGGQHRSVYLGEQLHAYLQAQGQKVLLRHRELS